MAHRIVLQRPNLLSSMQRRRPSACRLHPGAGTDQTIIGPNPITLPCSERALSREAAQLNNSVSTMPGAHLSPFFHTSPARHSGYTALR